MTSPLLIESANLSYSWIQILDYIVNNPGKEITPLVLSITDFEEDFEFRSTLNAKLAALKMDSIETVSETIFPMSLYQYSKNRESLYNEYLKILPRLKKIDSRNNRGTYFERLIAYEKNNNKVNQLEIIISSLETKKPNRRSKFQASIFDPTKDHLKGPYQRFPCLQHVTFYKSEGGLVLNSFYAIQYLFQRAYGNWLGLINLGKFMAKELNIEFERLNCFIGVEQLDQKILKKDAKKLLNEDKVKEILKKINQNYN